MNNKESVSVCGWYDVKLGKSYRDGQKHSFIDKIKLFCGYDVRKRSWAVFYKTSLTIKGVQALLIIYINGLGTMRAELQNHRGIEQVPIEWAKDIAGI